MKKIYSKLYNISTKVKFTYNIIKDELFKTKEKITKDKIKVFCKRNIRDIILNMITIASILLSSIYIFHNWEWYRSAVIYLLEFCSLYTLYFYLPQNIQDKFNYNK